MVKSSSSSSSSSICYYSDDDDEKMIIRSKKILLGQMVKLFGWETEIQTIHMTLLHFTSITFFNLPYPVDIIRIIIYFYVENQPDIIRYCQYYCEDLTCIKNLAIHVKKDKNRKHHKTYHCSTKDCHILINDLIMNYSDNEIDEDFIALTDESYDDPSDDGFKCYDCKKFYCIKCRNNGHEYEMEYPLICHKCGINPDVNVLFIQNKVKQAKLKKNV